MCICFVWLSEFLCESCENKVMSDTFPRVNWCPAEMGVTYGSDLAVAKLSSSLTEPKR